MVRMAKAYEKGGEGELATRKLGQFLTARYGSVSESKAKLGGLSVARMLFEMQTRLYST